jgi:hypothetical protein
MKILMMLGTLEPRPLAAVHGKQNMGVDSFDVERDGPLLVFLLFTFALFYCTFTILENGIMISEAFWLSL